MANAKLNWLTEPGNAELLRSALRGVEKESLRIDAHGALSHRPHPRALGSALTHPYLTTDYSEALLELVTPPLASNWATLQFLCDLHGFVHRNLDGELLWPASMPCAIDPLEEIPIAHYGSSNVGMMKTIYRRGLGYRYGRAMQAIAGVHFNYSLPDAFWEVYRDRSAARAALKDFKSESYMALVRNYRRCAWLVMYLFGASPAFCKSFRPEGHEILSELDRGTWYAPYATSLRMSELGYRNPNQSSLNISADSLEAYLAGLSAAVTTVEPAYERIGVEVEGAYRQLNANLLQIENEYYTAIRPKPSKSSKDRPLVALRRDGIDYVEVRTLDLSVADPVGVNQVELRVLETLLLDCLLRDSPPIDAAERREIEIREALVAKNGRRPGLAIPRAGREAGLAEWGAEILESLGEVAVLLDAEDQGYAGALAVAREAVRDPDATVSARLLESLRASGLSFFDYTLGQAAEHRSYLLALPVNAEQEERLVGLAARSRELARELELGGEPAFADYLAGYLEEI